MQASAIRTQRVTTQLSLVKHLQNLDLAASRTEQWDCFPLQYVLRMVERRWWGYYLSQMERPGGEWRGHEPQAGDLRAWLWTRLGLGGLPASRLWGWEMLPQIQLGPPWCLQWPCWPMSLTFSASRRNTWWQPPFSTVDFFDDCGQDSQAEL